MSTYMYVFILIYVYIHMYIYLYMSICPYIYIFLSISFSLMFFCWCVCACRYTCMIYIYYIYIYLKRYSDPFQRNPFQSTNPKHQITSDWISGKRSTMCGVNQACFSADLHIFCIFVSVLKWLNWLNWLIHPAMISMLRPGEIRLSPRGLGMFRHHSDDCCDLMTCDGGACENHNGFGPCVLFYGDQSCASWCSYA